VLKSTLSFLVCSINKKFTSTEILNFTCRDHVKENKRLRAEVADLKLELEAKKRRVDNAPLGLKNLFDNFLKFSLLITSV